LLSREDEQAKQSQVNPGVLGWISPLLIVNYREASVHGDAANADCGEERDYESRPSRTLPFRSRLARPLPLSVVSHTAHRVHALFFCFCEYSVCRYLVDCRGEPLLSREDEQAEQGQVDPRMLGGIVDPRKDEVGEGEHDVGQVRFEIGEQCCEVRVEGEEAP